MLKEAVDSLSEQMAQEGGGLRFEARQSTSEAQSVWICMESVLEQEAFPSLFCGFLVHRVSLG